MESPPLREQSTGPPWPPENVEIDHFKTEKNRLCHATLVTLHDSHRHTSTLIFGLGLKQAKETSFRPVSGGSGLI